MADAFARLEACGADAELIALAKRCLAPDREQRPRDASEVAAAVLAYQAGVEERARKAELDWAAAEARAVAEQARAEEAQARVAAEKKQAEEAEARAEEATAKARAECRARRVTLGLAAALLLLVIGGGAGAWLVLQQRAATAGGIRARIEQARSLRGDGWKKHDERKLAEAKVAAEQALEIARSSHASVALQQEAEAEGEETEKKIKAAKKNSALLAALLDVSEPRETARYTTTESGQMMALAEPSVEEQFVGAFQRWGLNVDSDALEDVVARLEAQPEAVVQEIISALDMWALDRRHKGLAEARWRRLHEVAERLDSNDRRKQLRRLLASSPMKRTPANAAAWDQARTRLLEETKKVDATTESVRSLLSLARVLQAFGETATAEGLLRSSVARYPNEVVLLVTLGDLLTNKKPPRLVEAIGCNRAARSLRPQLGIALSSRLVDANQAPEGEAVLRDLERLQVLTPDLYLYLGNALSAQKKLGEAVAAYRKAIALKPDYAGAYNNLGIVLADQKKLAEAETAYRKAIELKPDFVHPHVNLGAALLDQKKLGEAVAACKKAIALQPDLAGAYSNLGLALCDQKKLVEAEAAYRKAIALQPDLALAYHNLGIALPKQKKLAEAEAACRKAIALKPDYAEAYHNLGIALREQRKLDDAVVAFRKAVALKPDDAEAYQSLGAILCDDQKNPKEAEIAFRRVIALKPDYAEAHCNLGNALREQKKLVEAVAAYRKAIDLQPDLAKAYNNLGIALAAQNKLAEAEAAYGKAIALQPDYADAYYNLGDVLADQRKLDKAVPAYRKAIKIKLDYAEAYTNLGTVLHAQKKLDEAVATYRKAIELKPDLGFAYGNLALALRAQKKLEEAIAAFRKANQLLPNNPGFRSALRRTERWLELEQKLPAILANKEKPRTVQELLELGSFCAGYKHQYAAAVRFFNNAFTAEPKLADDLNAQHRYNAACAASLAAAGKGEDARNLNADQRSKLRKQAHEWLRADLDAYTKRAEKANKTVREAVKQPLSHWLQDDDLTTVREANELTALPEQERKAWQQLWEDVAALRKKCS